MEGRRGEYRTNYLNFNIDEKLSVVNTNNRADHLRDDGHVTKVSLDTGRLLKSGSSLLCLAELLKKSVVRTGKSALEAAANTASQKL